MTVFAKKTLKVTEWARVQDQIGALQLQLGGPIDLMMFSRRNDNDRNADDIYIGLPDKQLLAAFPGFAEIARDKLPDSLTVLVIREDGFADRFPDIDAKRR